ncbi:MAG: methyltransferase domain-containing protein [Candidatus Pacebacteria bacterium]|nr:methyltransferase domain-containing protein [Candidatus Paceibacterota bacterium]
MKFFYGSVTGNDIFDLEKILNPYLSPKQKKVAQLQLEIEEIEGSIDYLQRIHDPEKLIIGSSLPHFLKKIILKIIKPYTRYQVIFNDTVVATLEKTKIMLANLVVSLKNDDYHPYYYNAKKDHIYDFLQSKFRGTSVDIKKRQRVYLPYIKKAELNLNFPMVDIGCGRGEFLDLLVENNFSNLIGIDINDIYVRNLNRRNVRALNDDALSFLSERDRESLSLVSSFHLIEHLSFPKIFDFIQLAFLSLRENGLLILETPNPENLQVGAWSFYLDPTHKKQLPPQLIQSILEYVGFRKIELIKLSPFKTELKTNEEKLLYGPREYGIVATK